MATKRKKSTLKYPRRAQFTIQDVIALNDSLNQQTVRNHVRAAITLESIYVVGTKPVGGRGRPRFLLARCCTNN